MASDHIYLNINLDEEELTYRGYFLAVIYT
jgi:hypothetical protein